MEASVQKETRGFSRHAVEDLSLRRGEPEWVRDRRLAAWDTFENIPMPKRTDEEWRRTDIRRLPIQDVSPFTHEEDQVTSTGDLPVEISSMIPQDVESGGLAVQVDSTTIFSEFKEEIADQGVIFCDMKTAVEKHPELLQKYFMTNAVPAEENKFAALHGAFWTTGIFVYVPSGVEVELPIRNFVYGRGQGSSIFTHTLIVAEEDSSVVVIDSWTSPTTEEPALASNVIEIHAADSAQVRYIQLQDWGRNMWNFTTQKGILKQDAVINTLNVALGSKMTRSDLTGNLEGPGSLAEMLGVYFADENQIMDHHTKQMHISPFATSDLLIKGSLKDRARTIYSGLIKVMEHAQRTDAYQANRNLVLSRTARADTIPNLEIGANDVRCTHGATIGQVEEEYIFYLMSRGIKRSEAVKLIVEGFFDEVVERVPVPEVQEFVRAAIARKLGL